MKTRGLYTWPEWQKMAWAGTARESVEAFPRPSGIECPNILRVGERTQFCKANLTDTPILIECGSEMRRIVRCDVCEWYGCRLLGT